MKKVNLDKGKKDSPPMVLESLNAAARGVGWLNLTTDGGSGHGVWGKVCYEL